MQRSNRENWVDILKVTAIFSVIVLHYTEYFYISTTNVFTYILMHMVRWFSFGCIGFFILATGYLNSTKKIDVYYYKKIISIIIIFLIACIVSHFVITPYEGEGVFLYLKNAIDFYFWGYSGYYWYMNFYIAFFLIIPFLNIVINNISKKEHMLLIIISIIVISMPSFIQILGDYVDIIKLSGIKLPNYFSPDNFPFIYYFIGSYIKNYSPEVKCKRKIVVCLLLILLIQGVLDYWYLQRYSCQFELGQHVYSFNQYGNVFTVFACTLFMLVIKNEGEIKYSLPKKIIEFLSSHTLDIYLMLMVANKVVKKICETFGEIEMGRPRGFIVWILTEVLVGLLGAFMFDGVRIAIKVINRGPIKDKVERK